MNEKRRPALIEQYVTDRPVACKYAAPMSTQPNDPYDALLAEYIAAMAQERAEWTLVKDTSLGTIERVKAYARWLVAVERVKALSMRMHDDAGPESSTP